MKRQIKFTLSVCGILFLALLNLAQLHCSNRKRIGTIRECSEERAVAGEDASGHVR